MLPNPALFAIGTPDAYAIDNPSRFSGDADLKGNGHTTRLNQTGRANRSRRAHEGATIMQFRLQTKIAERMSCRLAVRGGFRAGPAAA